ncbi:S-adenosyl-L-methionine-dependent methyltransferase [Kockiozyma suomiensis]|uniref:S-adenosyl-L-methionine-dependent methyltransferase n=1 Tax=Kockiozyma suomiensis TaxID=1337062 RepID=UPI00334376CB
MFPHSAAELERLAFQHAIVSQILGGCFLPGIVNFVSNTELSILDCGSGSGAWANDIAFALPRSSVIGFDIYKVDIEFAAPNVKFDVVDANSALPYDDNSFDIIHSRNMMFAITDWPRYMTELKRVLKPGGSIHFIETVFPEIFKSNTPYLLDVVRFVTDELHVYYNVGRHLENLLPLAGLTSSLVKSYSFSFGPFGDNENDRRLGGLMQSCSIEGAEVLVRSYVAKSNLSETEAKPYFDDANKLFGTHNKSEGSLKYVVAGKH